MNTKHKAVEWNWLAIIAGTMAIATANAAHAQSTESAVGASYDQSCLAAYRDELAGWKPAQLDEDAYWRVVLGARAAAADSCLAFVERIEKERQPDAPESNHLRDARDLLADTPEGRCIEARVVSEVVRAAEALYTLATCHLPGEEGIALLHEAVLVDPRHLGALLLLTSFGLDSEARAVHGASLYELTQNLGERMSAAKAMIEWAVERGDSAAAQEIRERVRRHLLGLPPLNRCTADLDLLGLDEICLEAIESVASDALAVGEALPDEVIAQVAKKLWVSPLMIDLPNRVRSETEVAEMLATPVIRAKLIEEYSNVPKYKETIEDEAEFTRLLRGDPEYIALLEHDTRLSDWLGRKSWGVRKAEQAERLHAVLRDYPESLRNAEHYSALAFLASTWRKRIELLREAVKREPNHVGVQCELAEALAKTGDLDEARRGFRRLLTYDDGSCDAQWWLDYLDNETPTEPASLDEPHNVIMLR